MDQLSYAAHFSLLAHHASTIIAMNHCEFYAR